MAGFSCEDGAGACRWLGTLAVVLNIIKYSAPLSVMKRVIETRSVTYMPIHLTLACLCCSLSWGWYGIVVRRLPFFGLSCRTSWLRCIVCGMISGIPMASPVLPCVLPSPRPHSQSVIREKTRRPEPYAICPRFPGFLAPFGSLPL